MWCTDADQILDPNFKSVFDDFSICSPFVDPVHDFCHMNENVSISLIKDAVMSLSSESVLVIERQLTDFLSGGCFENVSIVTSMSLAHCPLTNLIGESAFGDIDYDFSKRRNASLHNRSALHCIKRNKTMNYLSKKPLGLQRKMLLSARRQGPEFRKESKVQEEKVKDSIRQKFLENQQKKIDKEMTEITRNSKIIDAITEQGGPCKTAEDVDNLVEHLHAARKNVSLAIKDQIRYQKLIHKQKLKFGPLPFMISTLKECLDPSSPPSKRRKLN